MDCSYEPAIHATFNVALSPWPGVVFNPFLELYFELANI